MKKDIDVIFRDSGKFKIEFDISPVCPHCGNTMSPVIFKSATTSASNDINSSVGLLLMCTFENCNRFFTLGYNLIRSSYGNYSSHLVSYTYSPPIRIDLPANIEKVSPQFVEIYAEATQAEQLKLGQIAGVGYRKSAEFLIKDYAINKNPTDEDAIKSKMLMQVITKYLDDFPKIQNLAKAIAWIGNDETHYERRHDDKDIKDLKKFIKAAAQFIAADYDADEALEFTTKD